MRKIFKSMMAVLLLVCSIVTVSACSCNKEDDKVVYIFSNNKSLDGTTTKQKYMKKEEAITYLTNIKNSNQNPTTFSLKDGVRVGINSINNGTYNINDFEMFIQEVNDVVIAQGSFKMVVGQATAESKFYHDGTYLGIETTENGQVDKQKEKLPLASIGNVIGKPSFIEDVLANITNQPSVNKVLEEINNVSDSYDSSVLIETTVTGDNCIVKDYFKLDWYGGIFLYIDTSYNTVGYMINYFGYEKSHQTITMPSDMDSWTTRPAA